MIIKNNKLNTFAEIRELKPPANMVFACALMQRMLPNYQLFSANTGFGDAHVAQSILNLMWDRCMSPKNKFNADVQLEKLEAITPDVDDFDVLAVYSALDFCMALNSCVSSYTDSIQNASVTVAKLSQGSVEAYILFTSDSELDNQEIKKHPLMQYEIETQASLVEFCKGNRMDRELIKSLREDLIAQNTSNLGIQLDQ